MLFKYCWKKSSKNFLHQIIKLVLRSKLFISCIFNRKVKKIINYKQNKCRYFIEMRSKIIIKILFHENDVQKFNSIVRSMKLYSSINLIKAVI